MSPSSNDDDTYTDTYKDTHMDTYKDINRLTDASASDAMLDATDQDILYNAGFSLSIGLLTLLVFVVLHHKLTRVYSGNLVGEQRPKLARRQGLFGWLVTTVTISDSQLLGFAGFDAFLQVQTIKLMLGIMIALAFPMLFVLTPVYYFSGHDAKLTSLYMKMSIVNCDSRFLWFPFTTCFATSLIIFYLVYLFYRNYALIRQAYLKDPSALTSALLLQTLVGITGSVEEARRVASLHNRSVIFDGISDKYDKDRLQRTMSGLHIAATSVASITFINPRDELVATVEERNKFVHSFELACWEFMGKAVGARVDSGCSEDEYLARLSGTVLTKARRLELLSKVLTAPSFHPEFRSKMKSDVAGDGGETVVEVDALQYSFDQLRRLDKRLDRLVDDYMHGYAGGDDDSDSQGGQQVPSAATSSSAKVPRAFQDQSTLISFKKFTWLSHNLKDLKLTLYGTSQSAVVVMESPRGASTISQTIISRRPFSLSARMAPAADDVLWDNLQLSPSDRNLRYTAGEIMFVLLNLFFIPVVSFLSSLTQLNKLLELLPFLDKLIPDNEKVRSVLQGILAPALLNASFNIAPIVLYYIIYSQGSNSKTGLQLSLISKFSWFLFFQSFVVIIIAASLVDVINDLIAGKWDKLLGSVRETFPLKSSLFFNIIIQKALVTLPMYIIKIGPLLMLVLQAALKRNQLPRNKVEQSLPTDLSYGQEYPQYLTLLLQITLAFMTITPVSVVGGVVYFGVALFVFRHVIIYSFRTRHESGGSAWPKVCDQIIIGCLLNQLFTLLHFTVRGAALQAIFLVPLVLGTVAFNRFLHHTFSSRIDYIPLSNEDEEVVDRLVEDLLAEQNKMLTTTPEAGPEQQDRREAVTKTADFVSIKESLYGVSKDKKEEKEAENQQQQQDLMKGVTAADLINPYANPVLFRQTATFVLHPALLPLVSQLDDGSQ